MESKRTNKYYPRITQRVRKISILFQKKIDSSSMNDYPCPPERKEIPSLYTKQHFHCRHNNLCIYIYKCVFSALVYSCCDTNDPPINRTGMHTYPVQMYHREQVHRGYLQVRRPTGLSGSERRRLR